MSRTLHLKAEVRALCEAARLDPKFVGSININPTSITFQVYVDPKLTGDDGSPLSIIVTHPLEL